MLPLLFLAGPLAAAAALLWVRGWSTVGLARRLDRVASRSLAVVTAALVVAWPVQYVRSLVGVPSPEQCQEKARVGEPRARNASQIDQLKQEVRLGRSAGPPVAVEVREVRELSHVTGPRSPGRTMERWGVGGTDLGHPFVLDGRLGLVFGDTFPEPTTGVPGRLSNVLAWVDERTPDSLVVTDMPESRPGQAAELLGSVKISGWEVTVIPTNSVAFDDQIVLHWMAVACWGTPGRWVVNTSGLAVSEDGGESFRLAGPRWQHGSGFAQVAFVPQEGFLYAFGIPEGRQGAVRLARVPMSRVLDHEAWRYWDGDRWSAREADAAVVVGAPVSELSVAWDERNETWLMMYLEEVRGGIVMRTAPELTGPWSRPRLVVSLVEHPAAYAPFLLPRLDDGPEVQFTMSRYDLYNVLLMQACLVPSAPTSVQDAVAAGQEDPCPQR